MSAIRFTVKSGSTAVRSMWSKAASLLGPRLAARGLTRESLKTVAVAYKRRTVAALQGKRAILASRAKLFQQSLANSRLTSRLPRRTLATASVPDAAWRRRAFLVMESLGVVLAIDFVVGLFDDDDLLPPELQFDMDEDQQAAAIAEFAAEMRETSGDPSWDNAESGEDLARLIATYMETDAGVNALQAGMVESEALRDIYTELAGVYLGLLAVDADDADVAEAVLVEADVEGVSRGALESSVRQGIVTAGQLAGQSSIGIRREDVRRQADADQAYFEQLVMNVGPATLVALMDLLALAESDESRFKDMTARMGLINRIPQWMADKERPFASSISF